MVGLGGIVARKTTGTPTYLFKDVHGDTTMLMQGTSQKGTYDYDAYGKQTDITGTADNPYRYCGEYTDEETGFIYLRNRYYDPSIGRFISEDPAKSGSNWYVYCENNPLKFVDPWGLEEIVISGGAYGGSDDPWPFEFIASAIKQIQNMQANTNESITWIVSDIGYSNEDINLIRSAAKDLDVRLVMIHNSDQLQNYLNSKSTTVWELTEARKNDKVRTVTMFSHGFIGSVELGYGNADRSKFSLDYNWIGGLIPAAFYSTTATFYACNTGTDVNGEWGNNFAQKWVDAVGGVAFAVNGKTDYIDVSGKYINAIGRKSTPLSASHKYKYPVASKGVFWIKFY